MKTMKQLLIVICLANALSVSAQNIYTMPEARMCSTSAMLGSGSTLPQAALTGTTTTYDNHSVEVTGPLRARPEDNKDPYEDPLGDALLPLMLLAVGYALIAIRKQRKMQNNA